MGGIPRGTASRRSRGIALSAAADGCRPRADPGDETERQKSTDSPCVGWVCHEILGWVFWPAQRCSSSTPKILSLCRGSEISCELNPMGFWRATNVRYFQEGTWRWCSLGEHGSRRTTSQRDVQEASRGEPRSLFHLRPDHANQTHNQTRRVRRRC